MRLSGHWAVDKKLDIVFLYLYNNVGLEMGWNGN